MAGWPVQCTPEVAPVARLATSPARPRSHATRTKIPQDFLLPFDYTEQEVYQEISSLVETLYTSKDRFYRCIGGYNLKPRQWITLAKVSIDDLPLCTGGLLGFSIIFAIIYPTAQS